MRPQPRGSSGSPLVSRSRGTLAAGSLGLLVLTSACTAAGAHESGQAQRSANSAPAGAATTSSGPGSSASTTTSPGSGSATPTAPQFRRPLPGMPPVLNNNVYAATGAGMLSPRIAKDPAYVYVPDSNGSTVTVIDQATHKVVRVIHSGMLSQHVNPSYDLRTLYADASAANRLQVIDPSTGKPRGGIPVPRPYNLYFTPNARQAVVMVEEYNQIMFADPQTFKPRQTLRVPGCRGPNHADFTANGRAMVVTCEFSGTVLMISTQHHTVLAKVQLPAGSIPQDVRLSPDGRTFYVADMGSNELRLYSWKNLRPLGSIATPAMPHGLIPSRDARLLYVTDRGAGEISVVSFAKRKIIDTWRIPGGGSPDMGGVSADGRVLWVSGRYDGVVYGFNTSTGKLIARIPVGGSPHGLLVWPQPGRYSMGHTGNMR